MSYIGNKLIIWSEVGYVTSLFEMTVIKHITNLLMCAPKNMCYTHT